jgi:hypothetical protein
VSLLKRLADASVRRLTQLACVLALVGLAVLCYSVISPQPLVIVFAMSVGHGIGAAAVGCYLLAVLLDFARREGRLPPRMSSPPTVPPPSARPI